MLERIQMLRRNSSWPALAIFATGLLLAGSCPLIADDVPSAPRPEPRPPWTSSHVVGSPEPEPLYLLERKYPGLSFQEPVILCRGPEGNRLFVVELRGKIYSFPETAQDMADVHLVADLKQRIPDLVHVYGFTFHPEFEKNRRCYVCYVLRGGIPDGSKVSEFLMPANDPLQLDLESEQVILTWRSGGHNGGCLKFGHDGYLYIATGDATSPFPPDDLDTGQDLSDLLSSILRIDVDRQEPGRRYAIPQDNPFVDLPEARPEIWSYGFRNPWKLSFDARTGDLWTADVGWELWEMVYRVERGGNYGWSVMEGRQTVRPEAQRGPTPILPPLVDHAHTEARSITGGVVYWGDELPDLRGSYIYGDYETGKIWGLRQEEGHVTWHAELVDSPIRVIAFGTDSRNEMLILDHGGGIYALRPNPRAGQASKFPRKLSETGLFDSLQNLQPATGVVPYTVIAEPWQDTATAARHVALPVAGKIDNTARPWKYPAGTVFSKTLSLDVVPDEQAESRRVETQLLHFDGKEWRGYSYRWNEVQDDATLVPAEGAEEEWLIKDPHFPGGERKHPWRFASRSECTLCHHLWVGHVIGFEPGQLGGPQLDALSAADMFTTPVDERWDVMADPRDAQADLEARARSYLHVNCAHCHRFGGGGTAAIQLDRRHPLKDLRAVGIRPTQGTFGLPQAEIIAAGDPARSVMFYRMATVGRGRMPHVGSRIVDVEGLRLIADWISSLDRSAESSNMQLASQEGMPSTSREALASLLRFCRNADRSCPAPELVQRSLATEDPLIRGLFENYVPLEARAERLGTSVNPEQILALRGDSQRGEVLFREAPGLQCRNCHRSGDVGKAVGPDLDKLTKENSRWQILESILHPSKKIAPQYVTYLAELDDGRLLTGLLLENSDDEIVLQDAQGERHTISRGEIEQLVPQANSLMPDLLVQDMTAQQLADLVEFLSSSFADLGGE